MGTSRAGSGVPLVEWAFRHDTVVGGVAPGQRTSKFNGHRVPYSPRPHPQDGARWCSPAWDDRRDGNRGFEVAVQGGISRFAMHVRGRVGHAQLHILVDDRVDIVAANASRLLAPTTEAESGVTEWSLGFVRFDGVTRPAIHIETVRGSVDPVFAAALEGVETEWILGFSGGFRGMSGDEPGYATLSTPDDEVVAEWNGPVRFEREPVPVAMLEIAVANGSPLLEVASRSSDEIEVGGPLLRSLEPDEIGVDRDVLTWIAARIDASA